MAKKVSHPYSGALSLKFWGFWGFLSSSNSCLGAIFVLIWDFLRCFLSSCGFCCSSQDKKLNFSWFSFKKNPSQNIKNGKALLSFCCEMKRREGTARHLNFVTTRSNLGQKNNLLLFFFNAFSSLSNYKSCELFISFPPGAHSALKSICCFLFSHLLDALSLWLLFISFSPLKPSGLTPKISRDFIFLSEI